MPMFCSRLRVELVLLGGNERRGVMGRKVGVRGRGNSRGPNGNRNKIPY